MAENEVKAADGAKAQKPENKPAKEKKPSVFKRMAAWFKTLRAEMKKIVWASRETVVKNSLLVLVYVVILAAAVGVLDYVFSAAIVGLSRLV